MARSNLRVEVQGARELRRTLKAAGEDLSDLKAVHQAVGALVGGVAAGMAPRKTGALAAGIRSARLAAGVAIRAGSAGVPYAAPIHWGWPKRNIEASLFMTRAAQESEPQWTALYWDELNKIIDRVKGDS